MVYIMIERVKTGIKGFDELVEGGIPKGSNVLLTGLPGTGKTVFGLQYLYNGAINGENGLYVSLDGPAESLKEQASQFGMDIDALEKKDKLSIMQIPLDKPKTNLFDMLEEEVKNIKPTRLVFDSLADFAINIDQFMIPLDYVGLGLDAFGMKADSMKKDKKYRDEIMPTMDQDPKGRVIYKGKDKERTSYLLINELGKLGTTNLIITDARRGGEQLTVDGVSEYTCDGVIVMSIKHIVKETVRSIEIQKMRNTDHELDSFILTFSKNGLAVQTEKVFEGSKISGISL